MVSATLTPARVLRRPRRLDARPLFGIFLMLVAVGGSIAFWSASTDTRAVLVPTRDLPAGATLGPADLAIARVRVDDAIYQAAVPADEQAELIGQQLAEPAHAQQVLARAQLASRPPLGPGQMALTIRVGSDTAVGGRVRPGDAVQVLATSNKGRPDSRTTVVLPRVTVFDIGRDERLTAINTAGPGGADQSQGPLGSLTLVVSQEQALQLAQAKWNGELDVALLPAEPR